MSVMFLYNAPEDSLPVVMTKTVSAQNTDGFYKIIHKIIEIAHENNYASGNLWHNYLTHFILSNENVFSLLCERRKAPKRISVMKFEAALTILSTSMTRKKMSRRGASPTF